MKVLESFRRKSLKIRWLIVGGCVDRNTLKVLKPPNTPVTEAVNKKIGRIGRILRVRVIYQ